MSHHEHHGDAPVAPHPHYKEYVVIILTLTVLTVLEVIAAGHSVRDRLPYGIFFGMMVGFAISKVLLVALFFMHLKYETKILRFTVFGPLAFFFVYVVVLIAEAGWRALIESPHVWMTS
jgi:cytochrome c oxidase subunit 4